MTLTIIDPTASWFKIMEMPLITHLRQQTVKGKELLSAEQIFDMTSNCIARIVNYTWLYRCPQCCDLIYNNCSEFELHFEHLCKSYGIKRKPSMVRMLKQSPYWNACMKSLDRCSAQLKLIWPNQLPLMTSMFSFTTQHRQFALPILQYLKPHQVRVYLDVTCSSTFRSWLTGANMENTGNH